MERTILLDEARLLIKESAQDSCEQDNLIRKIDHFMSCISDDVLYHKMQMDMV